MKEIRMPEGGYKYFFSRYEEPVAVVEPGEQVCIYTEDAFSGKVHSESDVPSTLGTFLFNPQTGPVYVKGAEAGDTLAVKIISIEFTRDFAVSSNQIEFGGLAANPGTRMLNPPLDEKVWIYERNGDIFTCRDNPKLTYPIRPFAGTISTAPANEVISALSPFSQGGNMDVTDICPGNTIYLASAVDGAYFYIGDVHARQGDGELIGTALEIPAKVTLEFEVIKNKTIKWPRIENDDYIMTVGSAKPMEDAARLAYYELIQWMCEDYGWERMEAYQALSQCGEMYVGNMVDTYYSLVAKINKKYL